MTLLKNNCRDLFNPLLKSLHVLGGSANTAEIEESVINILNLSEEKIKETYRGNISKLSYSLAVARNYLRKQGLIDSSGKGVWYLTSIGLNTLYLNPDEVVDYVQTLFIAEGKNNEALEEEINSELLADASSNEIKEMHWQEKVLEFLKEMQPARFERLCQRLLRELGFTNVEVTGKIGDGGIDGKGILKIGSVLSFHVVFQCKRYSSSVSTEEVRAFRGALEGRGDKGLFITTGTYTRDAHREAIREGAKQIDLISGLELTELLKGSKLGIRTELVERIHIDEEWFKTF